MWSPQNVEAGLQAASLIRLGIALLGPELDGQRGPGAALHICCMGWLAVLASFQDRCAPAWFQDHPLYVFRACGQAGLAQGLLALPSLATAIFVATRSWWWQQAARLFLASSFQALLWLSWTAAATSSAPGSGITQPGSKSRHAPATPASATPPDHRMAGANPVGAGQVSQPSPPDRNPSPPQRKRHHSATARWLFLAAVAAGCLISAANTLRTAAQPPPPSSPQLLLPGSVFELPRDITTSAWVLQAALLLGTAPSLDHLAAALPRSFTPGEASILTQALLALLAGSCAYLAGATRQGVVHVLWALHVEQPDPGMHVPAFCVLVLFWGLMMAACSGAALRPDKSVACARGGGGGGGPGLPRRAARGDAVAAAESSAEEIPAEGLRQRRKGAGTGTPGPGTAARRGSHPVLQQLEEELGQGRGSGGGGVLEWAECVLAAGGRWVAGAGAALSFVMLADLALWVLGRFVAASSQPRLATLAYWFACLAVAVPFMYVVSRASAARSEELVQQQRREQEQREQEQQQRQDGGKGAQGGGSGGGLCSSAHAACQGGGEGAVKGSHVNGAGVSSASGSQHTPRESRDQGSESRDHGGESRVNGAGTAAAVAPSTSPGGQHNVKERDQTREVQQPGGGPGLQQQQQPQDRRRRQRSALVAAVFRALGVPHIVMRKGYHLLAIVLFLPAFGWDVRMLQASLAVAGAVLVFVEVLRCLGPARLRAAIGGFMADFADARDSGPVYVTHFTLLLGIAVPVWMGDSVCGAAAGAMMAGLYGPEAARPMTAAGGAPLLSAAAARLLPSCRTVLGLSGLVSLGSGDTAAACIGFLVGRRRLFLRGASRKTWEGTLSGAAAMLGSWAVVCWWLDVRWALSWRLWGALGAVTGAVALLEAVTQQLDNVVVPLYYLTHLVLVMTGN